MNNMEFVKAVLNLDKKVKFEHWDFMGESYDVVVFDGIFSCKVLNHKNGVLSIEHFASSVSPHDAIYAMCACFDELKEKYGVRKIKIALNKVKLSLTAKSAKNPRKIFSYWFHQVV